MMKKATTGIKDLKDKKERKNIPVSYSLLHDQEYHNLSSFLKVSHEKRRAHSARHNNQDSIHVPMVLIR
jgi:hypothetical protein